MAPKIAPRYETLVGQDRTGQDMTENGPQLGDGLRNTASVEGLQYEKVVVHMDIFEPVPAQ